MNPVTQKDNGIQKEENKKSLKMGLLLIGFALMLCAGIYIIDCYKAEGVVTKEEVTEEEPVSKPGPVVGNDFKAVGNKVAFGEYNGQKIIWWVCETNEGKSLLVSADQIAKSAFDDSTIVEAASWERSTLRSFLNDSFINEAFNETERHCVLDTVITDDDITTNDKVFIINEKQYREYYAIANGMFNGRCWLMDRAADEVSRLQEGDIDRSGEDDHGLRVDKTCGVRPAIWVDAELLEGMILSFRVTCRDPGSSISL